MKKKILFISLLICALLSVMVLAACGPDTDEEKDPDPTGKSFIIEAESMNLSEYYGVGYSGGGAQDKAIQRGTKLTAAASNSLNKKDSAGNDFNEGYLVGFFNGEGTKFVFTFESDIAEENCTLKLRLGSEHGDIMFDPSLLTIKVNGTELSYDAFTVTGVSGEYGAFNDYELSGKINLVDNKLLGNNDIIIDGEVVLARPVKQQNTVELILKSNTYWTTNPNNPTGGPGIDCIKVVTEEAELSWADYWNGGFAVDVEIFEGEVEILHQVGYKNNFN